MNVTPDLDARFREAALAPGLVDVRYDVVESPLGDLLLAATPAGLCRISYTVDGARRVARAGVRRARAARAARRRAARARRVLRRPPPRLRPDLDLRVAPFHEAVLHELARVPYGQLDTYGGLAAKVGHPRAARAVGTVMNRNPIPIVLPCHRIVGANGSLTGYAGGLHVKRALLELEGATLAV